MQKVSDSIPDISSLKDQAISDMNNISQRSWRAACSQKRQCWPEHTDLVQESFMYVLQAGAAVFIYLPVLSLFCVCDIETAA